MENIKLIFHERIYYMQLRGQALSVHMYIFLMQLITNFIDATSVLLLFFITGSMANDLKMFGISYRDS